jgi:F-type H+-transporting ATPase subunit epsilon
LKVKVLELEKKLFDGEVERVVLPAANGEMCLLPNHISIITTLKEGALKVFKPNSEYPLVVRLKGGICSFSSNKAIFLIKRGEGIDNQFNFCMEIL